jgi:hypothetical protein
MSAAAAAMPPAMMSSDVVLGGLELELVRPDEVGAESDDLRVPFGGGTQLK